MSEVVVYSFEERAERLLKQGLPAISNSIELKAELLALCSEIGHNFNSQFKNGCKNCIGDAVILLSINLKKRKQMKNTNAKYIIKNKVVHIAGRRFNFALMSEEAIGEALAKYPEVSKFVEVNKPAEAKALAEAEAKALAEAEAKALAEAEAKALAEGAKTNKKK